MALQPVPQLCHGAGSWDDVSRGTGVHPGGDGVAAQGGEAHALGEALAVHLPPEHPQLDQPDQQVFGAVGGETVVAEALPVGVRGDLAAAAGLDVEFPVERQPERQAAHGEASPAQGSLMLPAVLVIELGLWLAHASLLTDAIVLRSCSRS